MPIWREPSQPTQPRPRVIEEASVSITPSAASALASVVAPTVVLGSLSITPSPAQALGSVVAPAVVKGSISITPNYLASIAGVAQPTVIKGSVSITPSFARAIASVIAPTVEPWLSGYAYRQQIPVNHTDDGAQANYQKWLTVNKTTGTSIPGTIYLQNHALSWASTVPNDVRFTKADGTSELDYWIESSDADTAQIVVELDAIPAHPDQGLPYIYYGKLNDITTSNGPNTFPFHDHFGDFSVSKYSGNPIFAGGATVHRQDASVFYDGTYYWLALPYWNSSTGVSYVTIYRSSLGDGSDWTYQYDIQKGAGEYSFGDVQLFKYGSTWYLFYQYSINSSYAPQRLAVATSTDITNPTSWSRYGSNPILSETGTGWESLKLMGPWVIKYGSTWYLFYTGAGGSPIQAHLGIATTSEANFPGGWTRYGSNPIIGAAYEPWGVEGTTIIKRGSTFLLLATEGKVNNYQKVRGWKSTNLLSWTEVPNTIILDKGSGWESAAALGVGFFYSDAYGTAEGNNQRFIYSGSTDAMAGSYVGTGQATLLNLDSLIAFAGLGKWSGDIANGSITNSILTLAPGAAWKAIQSATQANDVALRARARLNTPTNDPSYSQLLFSEVPVNDDALNIYGFKNGGVASSVWSTTKAGVTTTVSTAAIGFDAYHIFDLCRYISGTDTIRFYKDGVQVGSDTTTNVPIVDLAGVIRGYNVNALCDWILIRKYTLNEPTWGTPGSEEHPSIVVTPSPAQAKASVIAPTVVLGSITVVPGHTDARAQVIQPTVKPGNITYVPTPISAIAKAISPSVIYGVIIPSPISAIASVVGPVVVLSSISITPTEITAICQVVAPNVSIGEGVLYITPSPIDAIGGSVNPTVILGSISLTPTFITTLGGVVAPNVIQSSLFITPAFIKALGKVVAPTVLGGSITLTPESIKAIARGQNPAIIYGSMTVTPAFVKALAGVMSPTVLQGWVGRKLKLVIVTSQYRKVDVTTCQNRKVDVATTQKRKVRVLTGE